MSQKSQRARVALVVALLIGAAGMAAAGLSTGESKAGPTTAAKPDSAVPVQVARVEQHDVPHRLASVGTVQSLHTVVIRPQIDGIVTEVLFREGEILKRGAPIARLDDRAIAAALAQAEAEKASRAAQLRAAEVDQKRFAALAADHVISGQQIDQQAALVERLKADLQASEATIAAHRVRLSYTRIDSPVAGRVGIRRVDPGNLVRPSDEQGIVTVTQIDPISIVFTLPQEALGKLALGNGGAPPSVVAFDRDAGQRLAEGKVATFDNQIDAGSGTLSLRAEFANREGKLWPGQFVALQVEAGETPRALVFPSRALQQGLNGPYVFRVSEGHAEVLPVAVAYENDEIVAVESGLEAGDLVVVDGQSRLRAGTAVRASAGAAENDVTA